MSKELAVLLGSKLPPNDLPKYTVGYYEQDTILLSTRKKQIENVASRLEGRQQMALKSWPLPLIHAHVRVQKHLYRADSMNAFPPGMKKTLYNRPTVMVAQHCECMF